MNECTDRLYGGRRPGWVAVLGLLLAAAGCSRAFYRHQADREVYSLVDCANRETDSALVDYTIRPNPRSRLFDPSCPDRPPMPPDDPTSHRLMHCVDCKRGWPCWHCYGKTSFVANPVWKEYLSYNDDGEVVLDRDGAMEMALLNSREYQEELEDLYLSALDVTFQRFRFDAQFFGGNSTFFTADGPDRAGGRQSLLKTDTDLQMRKLFASGGELVVGMANSLVWQFAGPDDYSATTLLDFSLVQPLLRGAGRAVVLESLTESERELLAGIRQTERFHREFYTEIVEDYLSLLEQQILIRNQQNTVARLRHALAQVEEFFKAGRIQRRQVDQILQSVYARQVQLLRDTENYLNRLDAYKISLGVPPQLKVKIEDRLLRQFNLIDPDMTAARNAAAQLLNELRDPELVVEPSVLAEEVVRVIGLIGVQLEAVEEDLHTLRAALPARRQGLRRLAGREEVRFGQVDPSLCDITTLDRRAARLEKDFAALRPLLKTTMSDLRKFNQEALRAPSKHLIRIADELVDQVDQLSLIQAGARLDTASLEPSEMDPDETVEIARENRRDWKNARATLVDVWRQIEVTANDLESDLDVTFSGDINTKDNNPVRFRGTTGRLRVGLEFDAPLTRLEERNEYRSVLIAYQQARRDYLAFEDGVSGELRDIVRAIRLDQIQFEIQRAAVRTAISRVEQQRLELKQPPRPGVEEFTLGPTTARDTVEALSALLREQNSFLNTWVRYEVQRMNLDLDMGTMQLDDRGMWIDPGPMGATDTPAGKQAEDAPLPPG